MPRYSKVYGMIEEVNGCGLSTERYLCMLLDSTRITFHIDFCRQRLTFTLEGQCGGNRVYFDNPISAACVQRVHELIQMSYCGGKPTCTNITSAPTTDSEVTMALSQVFAHKVVEMVSRYAQEELYPSTQRLIYNSLEAQERQCK